MRSGQCMHCLDGHYLWVCSLQYDAVRIVSGSGDGTPQSNKSQKKRPRVVWTNAGGTPQPVGILQSTV